MSNTHINDFSLLCRLFGNLFYRQPNDPILASTFAWLAQGGLRQQWALDTDSQSELSLTLLEKQANPTELAPSYQALFAENDGLYFYYEICQKASDYLADFGYLLFEIGYKQGKNVAKIMASSGFKNIEVVKDLAGLDRVVIGQKIINKIEN